jgi:hypothetical protein
MGNPSYLTGRGQKDHGSKSVQAIISKTPSQQTSQEWWFLPIIIHGRHRFHVSWAQTGLGEKSEILSEKNLRKN